MRSVGGLVDIPDDLKAAGPVNLVQRWKGLPLSSQFALAGGAVLLASAVLIGALVSHEIEGIVVRNTANATAQYMESFIAPLSQDIAASDRLSSGAHRALDEIFDGTPLGDRVVSFKIWRPDGRVVAASDLSLEGRSFPIKDDLEQALQGNVSADFRKLAGAEAAGERAMGLPLLEVYSPIREVWSGRIIGAAEFYEVGTELERDLHQARLASWGAVYLVLTTIGALLYVIVLGGSRTIARQSAALTRQLNELTALADRNRGLRLRVQQAAGRASAMNDRALRRIGADLHDGPAQLLGFAALRLDSVRRAVPGASGGDVDAVERAVKDAIREIRTISKGLSLPEIEDRDPCALIRGVADAHAARTGTAVAVLCDLNPAITLSAATRICLYRFAQEGLSNAWRYADGEGQELRLSADGDALTFSVLDRGPGYGTAPLADGDTDFSGLGLSGLRDRVESLGGTFITGARADGPGAALTMELDLRTMS